MDPLTVEKLTSKADERLVEEEMAKFEQEMLNIKSIPIHEFAKSGNLTGVKRQVTSGVKPNVADGDGRQAIHLAAINGHVGIVKYLHEQGVSLTVQDHSGRQPLHAATVGAKQKVVRWLIEQHVPVDARDKKGRNVFHLAALGGSHKLLRWLLTFITTTVSTEAGRAMHLCDKDNNTALHFAAQRGHVPAIEYLVEEGLRVDDQNIVRGMMIRNHNLFSSWTAGYG